MKKILLTGVLLASSISFAQITLENTFPDNQYISTYTNDNDMFYVGSIFNTKNNNILYLYNSDFSVRKVINVPVPNGYKINYFTYNTTGKEVIFITKHIFNTDDKYEFIINVVSENNDIYRGMLLLVNEDGLLLKNFNEDGSSSFDYNTFLFNDPITKQNKLVINKSINTDSNTRKEWSEVYKLPTTSLAIQELEVIKSSLQAFPNPAQTTLNIVNPKNGTNNVEIYDITGRLILKKDFNSNENKISVDVQTLSNGNYIYKIGNSSAKFIKK